MLGAINLIFTTTESTDFTVGLIIMIIGIILSVTLFGLHIWRKNKIRGMQNFTRQNKESQGVWEFTKKNFLFFTACFSLVFVIVGITMMIN
ncbi:hypothetical protein [Mesoplasma photuris]|uniref:hypothetical protein n=1 Tax=Mesoplasma photuris TaxID=217731 RepID=UPI00146FA34A|nr:hypothetical protein [Mesoplasma photuris]